MSYKILFNPFERISEVKLFVFGLISLMLGSVLGFVFKGRFDGIFDLHFVDQINILNPLIDNVINTLILFLVFFSFGKYINPKTRMIDILNVSLISRIPIYFLSFSNFNGFISEVSNSIISKIDVDNITKIPTFEFSDIFILLVFAAISFIFLAWMIVLLWNGFKVSTNAKGIGNVVAFAFLIILTEILSKYLIITFNS